MENNSHELYCTCGCGLEKCQSCGMLLDDPEHDTDNPKAICQKEWENENGK